MRSPGVCIIHDSISEYHSGSQAKTGTFGPPENAHLISRARATCANETIRVQGLRTGRSYEFSTLQPVQSVDVRDASSLLNTRVFQRV
jgi:hypothetical protein